MRTRLALLLLLLATSIPVVQAQSKKWPDKPVRMVAPFAPGGGTDIVARMIAARLTEEFGQQFIVDNRPGAGGKIGTEIALRANPDGYTLVAMSPSYAANAALYDLPYDPIKDIAMIALVATGTRVLAVHPSVKANNLKEFIELARAKPGALSFGSSGIGSVSHLTVELFRQVTNTNMVHVPYKGEALAITALVGGEIQFIITGALAVLPQVRAGKLRGLAVTTEERSPAAPDLPAIGELVRGFSTSVWFGMSAPAGTPKEIISRLNQAIARIAKLSDVQERLRTDGMMPAQVTPEQFTNLVAREIATWSKVVKTGNIKVN